MEHDALDLEILILLSKVLQCVSQKGNERSKLLPLIALQRYFEDQKIVRYLTDRSVLVI
jgi:hypothetical protein